MMAEAEYNEEKGLLGPPRKPHRRYGSTSVNMKKPDHIVVHSVSKGDTIQGISLKYGVTVQQIKQHNKLWSPESMFLHKYLEIPLSQLGYESIIKKDPSLAHIPSLSSPSLSNGSSSRESESSCSGNSSPNLNKYSKEIHNSSPTSPNGLYDCSEKSSQEILTKIDSNIAQMKSNIEKMETYTYPMVDQMEVDDSCLPIRTGHRRQLSESNAYPKCWNQNGRYQNGWQDPVAPPPTMITNPSRTITMSLKRLLRDHEELYEL